MKRIFMLFLVALVATTALWAQNNVITYTANAKLPETLNSTDRGLHTNAFNVAISSHAFSNGTGTITFDGDVTRIGESAFYKSPGLTSVTIPNSVTTIGEEAFYNCTGLTSVTIPNSVTTIEYSAFYECYGLTSVTIGNSVTTIGFFAFCKCYGLTSITCLAVNPPACEGDSFYWVSKSIPVYVPARAVDAYKKALYWKDFANILEYVKYNLFVKGEQVTFDNCSDILGDGTMSYNDDTKTLTLNNANITYEEEHILSPHQDLVINCVGTNTFIATGANNGIEEFGGDVTITGSGSLSLSSNARPAIYTQHALTITDGCKVTAQSASSFAVSVASEPLTIDNATLIAKGNGKEATINGCSELIMKNGATIRSAHTYDAATHQFLTAGGEAKDDIIIGVAGTGLEELTIDNAPCTNKFIRNGHLLIKHNGKLFNALGGRVK